MSNKTYFNRGIVGELGKFNILGLGEIVRYNNKAKIKEENVAEHTFYVTTTILRVCDHYKITLADRLKALEFGIVHDIPEAITGDLPYDLKLNNPEIIPHLVKAEFVALEKNFPEHLETYKKYIEEEKQETIPAIIVKLADANSVLQYSSREIELGNQSADMKQINESSYERVSTLVKKLESKLGGEE